MLRNYLTIAYRNLKRRPGYAAINVGGLALGLAVCLLMLLFVRQHWRKDRFHTRADRIYRVTTTSLEGHRFASAPPPVGPALQQDYAGIEEIVRMKQFYNSLLRHGENRFGEVPYLYTEPSFFRAFDGFDLAKGSAQSALAKPLTAVLTPQMAQKLFGGEEPIGQTFTREGIGDFTVTGVLKERPASEPTHLEFDVIFSYATLKANERAYLEDWQHLGREYTYLLLEENARPAAIEQHLADLSERFYPSESERYHFQLQPLTGIGLQSMELWNKIQTGFLPSFLAYTLIGLALVVLVAASFNYVNLTVARSLRRAKEVGVRKAVGARREQLVAQFLAEALLMALGATLLAGLLLEGLVPAFKNLYVMRFLDAGLAFDLTAEPSLGLLLLCSGASVGLLAGLYPALVLSRPSPVRILKGGGSTALWKGLWRVNLRKGLMGLQLVFAIVLIVSAVLLYRQATSMLGADHGFRTEQVFSMKLHDASYATFKQEAAQVAGVAGVTAIQNLFVGGNFDFRALTRPSAPGDTVRRGNYYATDSTFAREMGLRFAARLPDAQARFGSGAAILLNEKATEALGFASPQAALGQPVSVAGEGPFIVAGVAEGVRFAGFLKEVEPLVLRYEPEELNQALVRVQGRGLRAVMDEVGAVWDRLGSVYPYAPRPYTRLLQMRYGPYRDLSFITGAMAFLAVVITCLGLAGLAAYTAQTRVKEIGVRKVFGASVWDVVRLLTGGFAAVFAGAMLVGVPLAWWLSARLWQPLFARPLPVSAGLFLMSVGALGALVLGVVGYQALKAALADPVDALRSE